MGRKRKRRRCAHKGERSAEIAEPEMAGDEVGEEEDDEDSTVNAPPGAADERQEETIEGLLEPFSREELLDLLAEACLRDPALLSRIAASAASDAAHRRLFVHGLGPGATSAALSVAFGPFGALDECHAVADRATGRCRGYGFVTYRRRSSARCALADASKRVEGRPVACQLASLGSAGPTPERTDRKLFVDKVTPSASHDGLRRFFCEFGEIEAGPLGADHATGLFRGYAIFLYKSPEGLMKELEEPRKLFDGCELHCRRAHRQTKKRATAAPADAGGQRNVTGDAALPVLLPKEIASTSATRPLSPLAKGISSDDFLFSQNARAGILGASPLATAVPSLPGRDTPDSQSGAVQSQISRLSSVGASTADMRGWSGMDEARLGTVLSWTIGVEGRRNGRLRKLLQSCCCHKDKIQLLVTGHACHGAYAARRKARRCSYLGCAVQMVISSVVIQVADSLLLPHREPVYQRQADKEHVNLVF